MKMLQPALRLEENELIPIEHIKALFGLCKWGWPPEDSIAERAFRNSWFSVMAYADTSPAAFARVVSDGVRYAFLVDTMTSPQFRRLGAGTFVVQHLISKCKNAGFGSVELFSSTDGVEFYSSIGFDRCDQSSPGMRLKL